MGPEPTAKISAAVTGREPIAKINAVVTVIQATIPILLAFGVVAMSQEQSAAITSAVVAWGGLVGTWFGRNLVTPVHDPRDNDGKRLVAAKD